MIAEVKKTPTETAIRMDEKFSNLRSQQVIMMAARFFTDNKILSRFIRQPK